MLDTCSQTIGLDLKFTISTEIVGEDKNMLRIIENPVNALFLFEICGIYDSININKNT